MKRIALRVGKDHAGERLDRFIAARGGLSRGLARRTLEAGGVFLDGRRCKVAGRAVRAGQQVVVNLAEGGREPPPAGDLPPLRLLLADRHLAAVDKPAGVAAQPTLTHDRGALPDLVARLLGGEVQVVHRLDRETSGVTVLARTREAAAALAEAFRRGTPAKTY
ncbi:MAG TPA: pseudouridine synthase, partial [Anaeromyxobacteraceae bacterium]|nr:pseudouridine synthase [Anaeromyxobacteraceae bacterium]